MGSIDISPSKQVTITTRRELVMLLKGAKRGKALVQTHSGEQSDCTGIPAYAAKQGRRCYADVIRQDGKAQRAAFKKWE